MENKAHHEPSKLPYQLIKQITNDFHEERILGRGAFGTVYKGVHENGREIAVKVLRNTSNTASSMLDDTEFQKEFYNLRGLKHQNIVQLVGFCNELVEEPILFQGRSVTAVSRHMALCFEFVHNGSLHKHISDESTGFNWHTRYRIIKGVCQGLKYLREGLKSPIMHFDLKPDNILLDKNMEPKIADFGLSKLIGEENTKKAMSSVGTRGYQPPEFIKRQIISREFDIFSLGVIIVKIIIGYGDYGSTVEMTNRKAVRHVRERWKRRLGESFSHKSVEVYCYQVKRCIEIALDCLNSNRQERPSIHYIVSSLNETETKISLRGMQTEEFYQRDFGTIGVEPQQSSRHGEPSMPTYAGNVPAMEPGTSRWSSLAEITNNFSQDRLIGWDHCGDVYKGVYGDGHVIAVKMFPNIPGIDSQVFQSDINDLLTARHPNIVHLIGYGYEVKHECTMHKGAVKFVNSTSLAMCYNYMPNGSLERYISDISSGLDWKTRYGIIKGICEGLNYLHEGRPGAHPILHVNLKPSNILLDKNMKPKLCDFGMARILGVGISKNPTYGMGTLGYMPPEFIDKQMISRKLDIFSLGVVIIELVTGKRLGFLDVSITEFLYLAHEKWRERLQKTVSGRSVEGYFQEVKECLAIAVMCVESDRHKRPAIGDIVHALNETDLNPQLNSELLDVHPLELCFRAATLLEVPRKKNAATMSLSCSLQLHNKGHDRVAFMIVANNPRRYFKEMPLCGIVPPRSAYTVTLTLMPSKETPFTSSVADFFTLYSIPMGEYGLQDIDRDFTKYESFFKKARETEGGDEVQEVRLTVKCCQQEADHGTTSSEIITTGNAQQVASIDVHPTEPWIVTTHHVGSLRVWNYKTMAMLDSIDDVGDEPAHVAIFIARKKWLIAGDRSGVIHVFSYYQKEHVVRFNAHSSCITTLVVHPNHPFVLSSSDDADHLIKLWDWGKGWKCTRDFRGHTSRVMQVTFNPKDSDSFASASWDGTVKIWSIYSNNPNNIITLDGYAPESLLCVDYFTRLDRHHLIAGCKDRTAQIWKLDTRELVDELEGHADRITAVNLHPELPVLITGSLDGTVRIWNSTTYVPENIIAFNLGAVYAFGCIRGSRRIIVGCHQGIAMIDISLP